MLAALIKNDQRRCEYKVNCSSGPQVNHNIGDSDFSISAESQHSNSATATFSEHPDHRNDIQSHQQLLISLREYEKIQATKADLKRRLAESSDTVLWLSSQLEQSRVNVGSPVESAPSLVVSCPDSVADPTSEDEIFAEIHHRVDTNQLLLSSNDVVSTPQAYAVSLPDSKQSKVIPDLRMLLLGTRLLRGEASAHVELRSETESQVVSTQRQSSIDDTQISAINKEAENVAIENVSQRNHSSSKSPCRVNVNLPLDSSLSEQSYSSFHPSTTTVFLSPCTAHREYEFRDLNKSETFNPVKTTETVPTSACDISSLNDNNQAQRESSKLIISHPIISEVPSSAANQFTSDHNSCHGVMFSTSDEFKRDRLVWRHIKHRSVFKMIKGVSICHVSQVNLGDFLLSSIWFSFERESDDKLNTAAHCDQVQTSMITLSSCVAHADVPENFHRNHTSPSQTCKNFLKGRGFDCASLLLDDKLDQNIHEVLRAPRDVHALFTDRFNPVSCALSFGKTRKLLLNVPAFNFALVANEFCSSIRHDAHQCHSPTSVKKGEYCYLNHRCIDDANAKSTHNKRSDWRSSAMEIRLQVKCKVPSSHIAYDLVHLDTLDSSDPVFFDVTRRYQLESRPPDWHLHSMRASNPEMSRKVSTKRRVPTSSVKVCDRLIKPAHLMLRVRVGDEVELQSSDAIVDICYANVKSFEGNRLNSLQSSFESDWDARSASISPISTSYLCSDELLHPKMENLFEVQVIKSSKFDVFIFDETKVKLRRPPRNELSVVKHQTTFEDTDNMKESIIVDQLIDSKSLELPTTAAIHQSYRKCRNFRSHAAPRIHHCSYWFPVRPPVPVHCDVKSAVPTKGSSRAIEDLKRDLVHHTILVFIIISSNCLPVGCHYGCVQTPLTSKTVAVHAGECRFLS